MEMKLQAEKAHNQTIIQGEKEHSPNKKPEAVVTTGNCRRCHVTSMWCILDSSNGQELLCSASSSTACIALSWTGGASEKKVEKEDYMFGYNLKSCYYRVAIKQGSKKYFAFEWEGQVYRYNVLPF